MCSSTEEVKIRLVYPTEDVYPRLDRSVCRSVTGTERTLSRGRTERKFELEMGSLALRRHPICFEGGV
ncbi:hypothetical protein E2C01_048320 [Portunus trituberculatus]|uniref:Uncharacterized protein n=1 Tax=Portunus trituberculatus TaxID=210409 RepID=A0A5B7GD07_PORTR|nr:hypothetical protein [Portunus trituberculatus]